MRKQLSRVAGKIAQCRIDFGDRSVGRTPWSARDASSRRCVKNQSAATTEEPTRGSAADEGVRPAICAIAGKRENSAALGNLAGRPERPPAARIGCHTTAAVLAAVFAMAAAAQPGQLAPVQPNTSMQDSNLKPALPGALAGVGIDQKLDHQVPLNLKFTDESGATVPLSSFFHSGKPVIIAPVYFRCPMLCTQILNGLESSLKVVSFNPGQDFEIVAVSFDPKDTFDIAAAKKKTYLKRYGRANTANGWHFLCGDEANIKALTDAIGFHYKYDPATDQFAHASGIMLLTPQGRLSRYFYGVEYSSRDIRLGLVEASHNKIGSPVDQLLLFCYHYDPSTGKYGALAINMVRAAGAGFVLIGGAVLLIALKREKRSDFVRHGL